MAWTSGKEVPEVSDSAPTPLKVLVRLFRMEKPRVQRHFPSRGTSSPRVRLAPHLFLHPIKRNRPLRPPDQLIPNQRGVSSPKLRCRGLPPEGTVSGLLRSNKIRGLCREICSR